MTLADYNQIVEGGRHTPGYGVGTAGAVALGQRDPEKIKAAGDFAASAIVTVQMTVAVRAYLTNRQSIKEADDGGPITSKPRRPAADAPGGVSAPSPRTYRTSEMNSEFRGEETTGNKVWPEGRAVTYFTPQELVQYKLHFKDGMILDANGRPFDTGKGLKGRAIFIMNKDGDLYATTAQEASKIHHSSLSGGKPVAGAGEIAVHHGKLRYLSDGSGHYTTSAEVHAQVFDRLSREGIKCDDGSVEVKWYSLSQ